MDAIVETKNVAGFTINVRYDHTPTESPRDWAPMATFFGFHNRYQSPDKPPHSDPYTALRAAQHKDNIWLPVYLYDHSGTCYKAANKNPFQCQWDSGLFGYIFVSRANARKAFGVKRITAATLAKIIEVMQSEVDTYSEWANGQVYCYEVLDPSGEQVDSCYGFIGDSDYPMTQGVEWVAAFIASNPMKIRQQGKAA